MLLKDVFEKYRIPLAMSVIEAEVAPHGLYPKESPQLEALARQMFRLPYIEVGSHTYSHPFVWDPALRRAQPADAGDTAYSLHIPGYTINLEREIVGSTRYIDEHLAPKDKPVRILQWSGDTMPNAKALEITYRAGLLNINGGDTFITRSNPSLTAVAPLGIRKGATCKSTRRSPTKTSTPICGRGRTMATSASSKPSK